MRAPLYILAGFLATASLNASGSIIYPVSIEDYCSPEVVWVIGEFSLESETFVEVRRNQGPFYEIVGTIAVEKSTHEHVSGVIRFVDTRNPMDGIGPRVIAALMPNGDGSYGLAGGYPWSGLTVPDQVRFLFRLGVAEDALWTWINDIMAIYGDEHNNLDARIESRAGDLASSDYEKRYLAYRFFGALDRFPRQLEQLRRALTADLAAFEPWDALKSAWNEKQYVELDSYPSEEQEVRSMIVAIRQVRPNIYRQVQELRPEVETGQPDAAYHLARIYDSLKLSDMALNLYVEAAEAGHVNSMYELSQRFRYPNYQPTDESRTWLRKAAELGSVSAQTELASTYLRRGEDQYDVAQGLYWYKRAAEMGDDFSMYRLGMAYLDGTAGTPEPAKALAWFKRSGSPFALYELGVMYRDGNGVPANPSTAFKYFEAAATDPAGNEGWLALAEAYADGIGIAVDLVEAYALAEFGTMLNGYNPHEFFELRS